MKLEGEELASISRDDWGLLADSLRKELEEYGGLLDLLREQQQQVLSRSADGLTATTSRIQSQMSAAHEARREREALVRELDRQEHAAVSMRNLLPMIPQVAQPLIQALVEDVERMIDTLRRKAGQNKLLLANAADTNRALINVLRPGTSTSVYGRDGHRRNMGQRGSGLHFKSSV